MKNFIMIALISIILISCGSKKEKDPLKPELSKESFLSLVASTGSCPEEVLSKLTQAQKDTLLIGMIHKNSQLGEDQEIKETPDYPSLILYKEDKIITLLGEVHIKDRLGHEIGLNILKNYPIHMVEGVPKEESDLLPAILNQSLDDREDKVETNKDVYQSTPRTSSSSSVAYSVYWDHKENRNNNSLSLKDYNCKNLELTADEILLCEESNQEIRDITDNLQTTCLEKGIESKECTKNRLSFKLESYYFINPTKFYPEEFRTNPNMDKENYDKFVEQYIMNQRNKRMSEASINLIETYNISQSLVIVGAAHLPGMKEIYEDNGYSVCRIKE